MRWEVTVVAMEPERLFSFTWCPYGHDDVRDDSSADQTLVEFRLEPVSGGTRVTVTESGFDRLPDDPRRWDALRSNAEGWTLQLASLANHASA